MWMLGAMLQTSAWLPQVWIVYKLPFESRLDCCLQFIHQKYVPQLCLGCVLSGFFFNTAWTDITCPELIKGVQHTPWILLFAHGLQLLSMSFIQCTCVLDLKKEALRQRSSAGTVFKKKSCPCSLCTKEVEWDVLHTCPECLGIFCASCQSKSKPE